jgi:hypothetical protein
LAARRGGDLMQLDWDELLTHLLGLNGREIAIVAKAGEGATSMVNTGKLKRAEVKDTETGDTLMVFTTGGAIYVPQDQFVFAYLRDEALHISSASMMFQLTPQ